MVTYSLKTIPKIVGKPRTKNQLLFDGVVLSLVKSLCLRKLRRARSPAHPSAPSLSILLASGASGMNNMIILGTSFSHMNGGEGGILFRGNEQVSPLECRQDS